MSEEREIKVGDRLIYISTDFSTGAHSPASDVVAKVTKRGFSTERGVKVSGLEYSRDRPYERWYVYFGEAPNRYRVYQETPDVIAYIDERCYYLNMRKKIKRLINDGDKFCKVKNTDIVDIYEIIKAYE